MGLLGSWLPGRQEPYRLNVVRRQVVLNSLRQLCECALYLPRHGSGHYLWTGDSVRAAIKYVVREQGPAMAVFPMPSPR